MTTDSPDGDASPVIVGAPDTLVLDLEFDMHGADTLYWMNQGRVMVGWLMKTGRPTQGNESDGLGHYWVRSDAVH